jgi:hypothetical protein
LPSPPGPILRSVVAAQTIPARPVSPKCPRRDFGGAFRTLLSEGSSHPLRAPLPAERILAVPPPLFILRQPTTAAGAEFVRAGDRGRTGDLVLGNPFEDDEVT